MGEVEKSLKDHVEMFMMFASLKMKIKVGVGNLPVVYEFPDVLPGTSPVSMAPYQMSASEL
ncbi:cellular nucleic acid-binding protein, partial [Trifolium medium]|nr:cellular nucleic acid-binding protein [Trifolium medium]